jgi:YD repeat-containing protein
LGSYKIKVTGADILPPTKPSSITVSAKTNNKISLKWDDASDDTGVAYYEVYRDGVKLGNVNSANYTDTGLLSDKSYSYIIKASDYEGNLSEASDEFVVSTCIDNYIPAAPSNLKGSANGLNSISISWDAASDDDGIRKYLIYRNDEYIGESTLLTFTDESTTLLTNTSYNYKVVSLDVDGNSSDYSGVLAVKTERDSNVPVVTDIAPKSGVFGKNVTLRGIAADDFGIASLKFQISKDKINWRDVKSFSYTALKYANESYDLDLTSLDEGQYYVRAVAKDISDNESDTTQNYKCGQFSIDHTAPAKPQGLSINCESGDIILNWNKNSETDVSKYNVYRAQESNGQYTLIAPNITGLQYADYNVSDNINYYYKISAVDNANNESEVTEPVNGKLIEDTVAPSIISLNYSSGSILPANPTLRVLAADNYKVSSVKMEYRLKDSSYEWNLIGNNSLNNRQGIVTFNWNTNNLQDGAYEIRVSALDNANNQSVFKTVYYNLNVEPPTKPVLTLTGGSCENELSWTKGNESDLAGFRIYRSENPGFGYKVISQATSTTFSDKMLKANKKYYYIVEAVDRVGNSINSDEASVQTKDEDIYAPTADAGVTEEEVGTDMDLTFDGSSSADNDIIKDYIWDFGDGTIMQGVSPIHQYKNPGVYNAVLTVVDMHRNKAQATKKVTVYDKNNISKLDIKVTDEKGNPLSGANIVVKFLNGNDISYVANSEGIKTIYVQAGTYKVYAYKDGYKPKEVDADVKLYRSNTAIVALLYGPLVTGELTVHKMTLDEIENAHINTEAPENQYVYKYTMALEFQEEPLVTIYVNGEGQILSDDPRIEVTAVPVPNHPEVSPTLFYVYVDGETKWLKEFFNVTLNIKNTADPQFVLTNSNVKLNIPDGLSVVKTKDSSNQTVDVGDIAGGQQKTINWIVRGDKEGEYDISALYNGMLQPFNTPITAQFATKNKVKVWGSQALKMHVYADDKILDDQPYYIKVGFENISHIDINKLTISLKPGEGAYQIPQTLMSNSSKYFETLKPGETKWVVYCIIPVLKDKDKKSALEYLKSLNIFNVSSNCGGIVNWDFQATTPKWQGKVTLPNQANNPKNNTKSAQDEEGNVSDPVNTFTGAQQIDGLILKEDGKIPFDFGIKYDSNLLGKGELGTGWTYDYGIKLEILDDQTAIIHWNQNSSSIYFIGNNSDYYSMDSEVKGSQLVKNLDGSYTFTTSDQNKYMFNTEGKLIQIKDQHGNVLVLSYDASGNLAEVKEPISNQYIDFKHNEKGLISEVTDEINRKVSFAYDENNNLIEVIHVNSDITKYTYNSDGRILLAVDGNGKKLFENKYDTEGRIIEQHDAVEAHKPTTFNYQADSAGNTVTTVTDRIGNQKVFSYDSKGNMLSLTNELGKKKEYTYDSNGNRLSEKDENGNIKTYTYDERGNRLSVTDEEDNVTVMEYTYCNNLASVQNSVYGKTIYTYDANNNLIGILDPNGGLTKAIYDENSLLTSETTPNLNITTYTYNAGEVETKTDSNGNKSTFEYDAAGRAVTVTDRNGNKTYFTYDNSDNLIEAKDSLGAAKKYTYDNNMNKLTEEDSKGNITNYAYNDNGDLASTTDPLGNTTKYEYNDEQRLTKVIYPSGAFEETAYDAAGRVICKTDTAGIYTKFEYDAVGNVISKTVKGQGTTKFTYYKNNKLHTVTAPSGDTIEYKYDPAGRLMNTLDTVEKSTYFVYDAADNIILSSDPMGNAIKTTYDAEHNKLTETDALGNTTKYEYNAEGKVICVTDPIGNQTKYEYDAGGRLVSSTNKVGNKTTYEYDAASNLIKTTDPLGGTTSYTYDSEHNKITETDLKGNVTKYEYNKNNKVVSKTDASGNKTTYEYNTDGKLVKVTEANGNETKYEYDNAGRIVKQTDPEGKVTSIEYNENGLVSKKITPENGLNQYTYDANGKLQTVTDAVYNVTTYSYDLAGRVSSITDANGKATRFEYDKNDNLVKVTDKLGNAVEYTYDANNNKLTVKDANGNVTKYEYNANGKVTAMIDALGNKTQYEYDKNGNVTKTIDAEGNENTAVYDEKGRATSETDAMGNTQNISYDIAGNVILQKDALGVDVFKGEYDNNNNLIKQTDALGNETINQYDNLNRLVQSLDPKGNATKYNYDKLDRLVSAVDALNGTSRQEYASNGKLASTTDPNNNVTQYSYDAAGNLINETYASGRELQYEYNNQNLISRVTNGRKQETDQTYDAEGRLITSKSAEGNTNYIVSR